MRGGGLRAGQPHRRRTARARRRRRGPPAGRRRTGGRRRWPGPGRARRSTSRGTCRGLRGDVVGARASGPSGCRRTTSSTPGSRGSQHLGAAPRRAGGAASPAGPDQARERRRWMPWVVRRRAARSSGAGAPSGCRRRASGSSAQSRSLSRPELVAHPDHRQAAEAEDDRVRRAGSGRRRPGRRPRARPARPASRRSGGRRLPGSPGTPGRAPRSRGSRRSSSRTGSAGARSRRARRPPASSSSIAQPMSSWQRSVGDPRRWSTGAAAAAAGRGWRGATSRLASIDQICTIRLLW